MFPDNVLLSLSDSADLQAAFNSVNVWTIENSMAFDGSQNKLINSES
jgi:hypothetical protein